MYIHPPKLIGLIPLRKVLIIIIKGKKNEIKRIHTHWQIYQQTQNHG